MRHLDRQHSETLGRYFALEIVDQTRRFGPLTETNLDRDLQGGHNADMYAVGFRFNGAAGFGTELLIVRQPPE